METSTEDARNSRTRRRLRRTRSESVFIFIPGSTFREQAGTNTREPSSSTTHTRQTFTGVRFSRKQSVGVSMPSWRAASRIVAPSGTETLFPSICVSTWCCAACWRHVWERSARDRDERNGCVQRFAHEKTLQRLSAESSALDAVCPRPQIEASRMACAISCSRCNSCSFEPSGFFAIIRSRASFCRVTPTRHGTHWPQVSCERIRRCAEESVSGPWSRQKA